MIVARGQDIQRMGSDAGLPLPNIKGLDPVTSETDENTRGERNERDHRRKRPPGPRRSTVDLYAQPDKDADRQELDMRGVPLSRPPSTPFLKRKNETKTIVTIE